jgi:hypothetical protein
MRRAKVARSADPVVAALGPAGRLVAHRDLGPPGLVQWADRRSPIAERQGRRALQLSGGDLSGLLGGPVSYAIYALICILVAPLARRHLLPPGAVQPSAVRRSGWV